MKYVCSVRTEYPQNKGPRHLENVEPHSSNARYAEYIARNYHTLSVSFPGRYWLLFPLSMQFLCVPGLEQCHPTINRTVTKQFVPKRDPPFIHCLTSSTLASRSENVRSVSSPFANSLTKPRPVSRKTSIFLLIHRNFA